MCQMASSTKRGSSGLGATYPALHCTLPCTQAPRLVGQAEAEVAQQQREQHLVVDGRQAAAHAGSQLLRRLPRRDAPAAPLPGRVRERAQGQVALGRVAAAVRCHDLLQVAAHHAAADAHREHARRQLVRQPPRDLRRLTACRAVAGPEELGAAQLQVLRSCMTA